MEKATEVSGRKGVESIIRVGSLLLLFIFTSTARLFSQADESNISKNLKAIREEQERLAHEEFMSYVYMTVGFAIVIAIAWITTVMARKRSKREAEEKQRYILKQQELRKHGHHGHAHGHHHGLHKARR